MTEPPGGDLAEEEALRRQLEEEMRRIRVEDVVVQSTVTLVNLAAQRLGLTGEPGQRDMGQAKLGIEAARALLPHVPAQAQAQIRDGLSQLQIAFAREARAGEEPGEGGGEAPAEGPAPQEERERPHGDPLMDEAERAKARSRIWTPPGSGT